jgi:uncharacterized protein (DUF427 family)
MDVMAKAMWENTVLAESDKTIEVEGNPYFPPDPIKHEYFHASDRHTTCPWKGRRAITTSTSMESVIPNAAWYYAEPKPAAKQIRGYVAYWKGVKVERN